LARNLKQNIEIKIILDSRERDETLLKTIKMDKSFKSDKIKICQIEKKCFKALGVKTSTGDLGIEYRFEGETRWKKTKLSIELKRDADIFSTLYSNIKRFRKELDRSDKYDLDFYILHNWTFNQIKEHIVKLQKKKRIGYKSQPFLTFLNNYLDVTKRCAVVNCGDNFEETIRRIIKIHILKNKLQYNVDKQLKL